MFKKISTMFVVVLLLVYITGCGNEKMKATIIDKGGTATELTIDELKEQISGNVISFNEKYLSGKITLEGKIATIKETSGFVSSDGFSCGTYLTKYYQQLVDIELEEDWIHLTIRKDSDKVDISSLKAGDTITITSNIAYAKVYDGKPHLYVHSDDGEHCKFGNTETVVTKKD